MTMSMRSLGVICVLLGLVAGCGDDGEGGTPTPAPTATAVPVTATPPPTSTATAVPPTATASFTRPPATATATPTATEVPTATATVEPSTPLEFLDTPDDLLTLAGMRTLRLSVPEDAIAGSLVVTVDGEDVTDQLSSDGSPRTVTLDFAAGLHMLSANVETARGPMSAETSFEAVVLLEPEECEILNDVECFLPYPSSRFLTPADTPTGWRLALPQVGVPRQNGQRIQVEQFNVIDGFSPTVQILMHFPGQVDIPASAAPRLLEETRSTDTRSLDADSPSLLIDAETGEQILHFLENDVRATDTPERQVTFLRPGRSLEPNHRYIVAIRNLVHPDGSPVEAETVFAALRDQQPSDIPSLEARRASMEGIFAQLETFGVARDDLILAFDFHTQSDTGLTEQMLSMRDQAFAWLDEQIDAGATTFTVDRVVENDCAVPGTLTWRRVEGTYQVPLFLAADPVADFGVVANLMTDDDGLPVSDGFTTPPFTIGIPCTVLDAERPPASPMILGHGLFGTGRGFVNDLSSGIEGVPDPGLFHYILGGTDWWGLSNPDLEPLAESFIVSILTNLNQFSALPDRLRQGQLNTLVLGRMMRRAAFNLDPAFRRPDESGAFVALPPEESYYLGGSLGGIMGLMFSALSPDIGKADIVVGAVNFSLLLQRATPFLELEGLLELTGLSDPLHQALGISVLHELWVRGESAGYATHITSDPLPATNAKQILMNVAWLDQQVSNTGSEIAARTLGLPNLKPGSLVSDLPQIPDMPGPLDSALVVYDTGAFELDNPAHEPFIPPLANTQAEPNRCDPHGSSSTSPAALLQVAAFFQPDGQVENFCTGDCDAGEPFEIPGGASEPCDPLNR